MAASVPKTAIQSTSPSGNVSCVSREEWHLPSHLLHNNDKVDTKAGGGVASLDSPLVTASSTC